MTECKKLIYIAIFGTALTGAAHAQSSFRVLTSSETAMCAHFSSQLGWLKEEARSAKQTVLNSTANRRSCSSVDYYNDKVAVSNRLASVFNNRNSLFNSRCGNTKVRESDYQAICNGSAFGVSFYSTYFCSGLRTSGKTSATEGYYHLASDDISDRLNALDSLGARPAESADRLAPIAINANEDRLISPDSCKVDN